jgi:secreted trypsin-like serine protease
MQTIMQTIMQTTFTAALGSALALLGGACDDGHGAPGREMTLDQADGRAIEQAIWSVSIQRMGTEGPHWCSGAIITDSWILTAAHCVEDKPVASLQVRAGLGDTTAEPLLRGIEQVVIHPRHVQRRLGHDHDLALLRLSGPLSGSGAEVAAIALGKAADLDSTSPGTMGLVNGKASSDEGSEVLLVVPVELLSNAEARETYRIPISREQIASKPMEGTTCQADGGSPLVLDTLDGPRLVGVASEGTGCASPSPPQIYTRVSSYLEWIDSEVD